ncbi:MAG: TonB-dependent receptor plug domain-containing protein [Vicinamibacterales bacterium]
MRVLVAVWSLFVCLFHAVTCAGAQQGAVHVIVRSDGVPLAGATVSAGAAEATTNDSGEATLLLPAGSTTVVAAKDGFLPDTADLTVIAAGEHDLTMELTEQPELEEEVIVVGAMRNERRVEDQAMRVEVLPREEIEEKMMMTPGDIVMMLNEMGGMRVQATSPSLGAASVRIQGMRGRYTRVLSDGLPLFGDVAGLGLLQIPPMDLGQVEVIKGVASALYGAGAMGGVINLASRRPSGRAQRELLINRSVLGATDATTFLSGPLSGGWSGTLLAGGHWQSINDVSGDGWADLPGYERAVVRPRLFWENGAGNTFFATAGFTGESRTGGTVEGRSLPATGRPHVESLDTKRYDSGAVAQFLVRRRYVVTARAAFNRQHHQHRFGDRRERDRHATTFAEIAMRGASGPHGWIAGLAFQRDVYAARDLPAMDYAYTVPGLFGQYDVDVNSSLAISASGRIDLHSEYGTFVSPRVSARVRRGGWIGRLSAGGGFFAPTPITEDTEAAGLAGLVVRRPLEAERGRSASFDLTRRQGVFSYTATLFASRIANAVRVDRSPVYVLRNLSDPTLNVGIELLGTMRRAPYALTGTYTYVHARESDGGVRQDVPLTPRHSVGIVAMWEREDIGRAGLEFYVTGRQRLEENPYRDFSVPYVIVGALVERRVGPMRLFINGENLTNVRQTSWNPLLRPARGADGRWAVDAWSPLEGRNVNGGIRFSF